MNWSQTSLSRTPRGRALAALLGLGLGVGTACSSTPAGPTTEAVPAVDACKTYCADCGDNQCLDQCVDARKKTAAACQSKFDTLFLCGAKAVAKEERCVKGFAPDTSCRSEAAAVDACTTVPEPEAGPPPPIPEAGACNGLGVRCDQGGGGCCAGTSCSDTTVLCCARTNSACTKSADCCNVFGTEACVAGKCGPKPTAPACYDKDAALALQGTAPTRTPGLCTATEISTFETACLGSGGRTSAACTAALAATSRGCTRCLFGALPGDDPATTPVGALLPTSADSITPNVASCAAIVIGRSDCAVALAQEVTCVSTSCSTCTTDADDAACTAVAETDICKSTVNLACNAALNAAIAQWTPLCKGATFADGYRKVAMELCGAP